MCCIGVEQFSIISCFIDIDQYFMIKITNVLRGEGKCQLEQRQLERRAMFLKAAVDETISDIDNAKGKLFDHPSENV
jgi:hypothetical protein